MNLNYIFKIFKLIMLFFTTIVIFSLSVSAEDKNINSLSGILIDKPIDNNYRLNLYFANHFNGSAFLQKRKNGSFYVFIPDTVLSSKKVKINYKGNVNKSIVRLNIEELPYEKENTKSQYLRLSVETPVNSDIQLTSQTFVPGNSIVDSEFMKNYLIIIGILFTIALILSFAIYRAVKKINSKSNTFTTFPSEFLNSQTNYTPPSDNKFERPIKLDVDAKMISPISTNDFNCFNIPLNSDDDDVNTHPKENKSLQDIKSIINEEKELYRPELVSELKIDDNTGFYLTTVGDNSFALFGYTKENIFFLQKFKDLSQVNLQARFYERKDGCDIYIIRLDSYKAMLSVSDKEIKELAVI